MNANDEGVRAIVQGELRRHFRPEFLNRIDEIVFFNRLREEDMEKIVDIQLQRFRKRLDDRKLGLTVTDEARKLLAHEGYDPQYGARPLKRVLQQRLENPLALQLLEGRYPPGSHIVVDVVGGKFDFRYAD